MIEAPVISFTPQRSSHYSNSYTQNSNQQAMDPAPGSTPQHQQVHCPPSRPECPPKQKPSYTPRSPKMDPAPGNGPDPQVPPYFPSVHTQQNHPPSKQPTCPPNQQQIIDTSQQAAVDIAQHQTTYPPPAWPANLPREHTFQQPSQQQQQNHQQQMYAPQHQPMHSQQVAPMYYSVQPQGEQPGYLPQFLPGYAHTIPESNVSGVPPAVVQPMPKSNTCNNSQTPTGVVIQKTGETNTPNSDFTLLYAITVSCFAIVCCGCCSLICTIPAAFLAVQASDAEKKGDMAKMRTQNGISVLLTTVGLISAVLCMIIVLVAIIS